MKKSILVVLAIVLAGVCALLFSLFYNEAKHTAIARLNEEQRIHARQAAQGIGDFFATWTRNLEPLSKMDEIVDNAPAGQRYLNLFLEANQDQIVSMSRMDERGVILYNSPQSDSVGSDISNQKHVRELLRDHKPVISDVFRAIEGFDAIALHVPVFKGAEFKGSVGILINYESLARRYLDVIQIGPTGRAWVVSRDGTLLYSPIPELTGKSALDAMKDSPSRINMVHDMLQGHEAAATYLSERSGSRQRAAENNAPVTVRNAQQTRNYAVYMPVHIGNTFWSIAVASDEQDVLSGLNSFRNKLACVLGALFLCGIMFSIVGAKAWFLVKEQEQRKLAEKLQKTEQTARMATQEVTEHKRMEEALRQSRERLDLALRSSSMATFDWDLLRDKRTWDDQVHHLLGTKPETFTGTTQEFFQVIHPEDHSAVKAAIARAVETGDYENDYRAVWPDGSIHHISARGKVYRNPAGQPALMSGVCWETTERIEAEARIAHLNRELQQKLGEVEEANAALTASRQSALSLAGDAVNARKEAERANAELQSKNQFLSASRLAALNLMDDALKARQQAEAAALEQQKLNRALTALKESSHAMTRATSESQYLDEVCKTLLANCGHAMVWIGFAENDAARTVRPAACAGFEQSYLDSLKITWADTERGRGPTGTAIRTGKPCRCKNMLTDPAFAPWRAEALKHGYASSLVAPLLSQDKAFGAITIYSRQPDAFSDDEIRLLAELADDASTCIRSLRAIAERQRTEQQLYLLSTAVESAANGIAVTDSAGRILWINPAFTRMTGYSPAEAVGQNPRVLKSGRHSPEFYRLMWNTLVKGENWHGELVNRRKDGSFYPEEMTIAPVRVHGAEVTHYVAIKQDITARKRAERRTELLAETASHLLSSDEPQLVVEELCGKVLDFLDCQLFFNFLVDDSQQRLHLNACSGISKEQAAKIEWLDYGVAVCGCAARDGCRIVAANIQETPDPRTELVKSYGVQAYACHPLMIADRLLGTLSFGTRTRKNFTEEELSFMKAVSDLVATAMERKRTQAALQFTAEEAKRSNRDLEQFAYIASHDLQEPLRAVGGYVRLIQRRFPENIDAKAVQFINGAAEGADRMERLITDLLAFSRVGTHGGAFSTASLEAVLSEALRNLHSSIQDAQAKVTTDPLPTLTVDATQMMQIFQNLIGNAIKFHSERPPEIHVSAKKEPGRWVLSVRDNGIGIEPQYYDRIFQIFQRLHTRRHYPGTGIGLAICKKMVERHGGAIWVESTPGQGSTFCFSLPDTSAMKQPNT